MAAYLQTDEIAAGSPSSAVSSNSTIDENDVAKVLERRLESKNFKLIAWNLKPVGKQMGFGGSYFHLSAVVHFHGETSSFRFFVKTPPDRQSVQYEFFTRFDTFNKEITFYEDVMKFLGAGSRAKWLPHCYLGKRDVAIVLEDAVMENYRLADKYLPFDHKHCLVVLKTLANLHGRSIIAEEKLKERNNNSEVRGTFISNVCFESITSLQLMLLLFFVYFCRVTPATCVICTLFWLKKWW